MVINKSKHSVGNYLGKKMRENASIGFYCLCNGANTAVVGPGYRVGGHMQLDEAVVGEFA